MLTLDEYFDGHRASRIRFDAVWRLVKDMPVVDLKVTKSQIALRRKRAFAWMWIPGKYLRGNVAPLVLTLAFRERDPSPRWKEIVEPAPGRFMHHLELCSIKDIDEEVHQWLRIAWNMAG